MIFVFLFLQGYECGGQKLLIKFPDNPIVNGTGSVTIRKSSVPSGTLILQKSKQPNKYVHIIFDLSDFNYFL